MEEKELESNIDYDVLNALNLIDERIGNFYRETGFNPFDASFKISPEFTEKKIKQNRINKAKEFYFDFLEKSNKSVAKNCENALENTDKILQELGLVDDKHSEVSWALQIRKEILKFAIQQLKNNNENSYDLFQLINRTGCEFADVLLETFDEHCDVKKVAIEFQKHLQKEESEKKKKELERAKELQAKYVLSEEEKLGKKVIKEKQEKQIQEEIVKEAEKKAEEIKKEIEKKTQIKKETPLTKKEPTKQKDLDREL